MTDPTPTDEPIEEPTATTQTPQTEPIDPQRMARSWPAKRGRGARNTRHPRVRPKPCPHP